MSHKHHSEEPDYYYPGYPPYAAGNENPGYSYINNNYSDNDYTEKHKKHRSRRERDDMDDDYYGQMPQYTQYPYSGGAYGNSMPAYYGEPYQAGQNYNNGPYSASNLLSKIGPFMGIIKVLAPRLLGISSFLPF